eukprot:TRINITY_DN8173_c0_g1_i3.p2 TRINITY_DN8173_c0_g1~~TRINITY_DN8173_c0_g1_i3.p2  ORF type:complete len:193 (-),score=21.36 TRINITY_DN8173_c0_g1_i3:263-772(-)
MPSMRCALLFRHAFSGRPLQRHPATSTAFLCHRAFSDRPTGRAGEFRDMAEQLAGKSFKSKYLDRLRGKVNTEQAAKEIETDMYGEMASSLGRAGDKVDFLMLKLELLEHNGGSAADFNALRMDAMRARDELVIQRIACGFRYRAEEFAAERYPIPGPKGTDSDVSKRG